MAAEQKMILLMKEWMLEVADTFAEKENNAFTSIVQSFPVSNNTNAHQLEQLNDNIKSRIILGLQNGFLLTIVTKPSANQGDVRISSHKTKLKSLAWHAWHA